MGTPETAMVSGVPAFFSRRVSLWFPLSAGNALDELLHPLCAVAFHLVRHMTVDIQGKGGRGVSQIPLYGLDIIPALNRGHGVAMAKVC